MPRVRREKRLARRTAGRKDRRQTVFTPGKTFS
jgi:hypothetical protein